MVLAYSKSRRQSVYSTCAALRSDGCCAVSLPHEWVGDDVVVYLAFASSNYRLCSNSVCLGEFCVEPVGNDDDEVDGGCFSHAGGMAVCELLAGADDLDSGDVVDCLAPPE